MSGEAIDSLARKVSKLKRAALYNHWASSVSSFVYGANLLTIDEHDSVQKTFPSRTDFALIWKELDKNNDIWVIKSRQNMASWALRASDLHLVLFRPNVKIALIFDDKDDGIDHIENRIKPLFESAPEWLRELYTLRDLKGVFAIESFQGEPWRSYIEPIARGSNKLRSRTYTRIEWEEAATQDWMAEAYMGAKPTVQGKRDLETGEIKKGQIVIVSTPQPDTFYLELGGKHVDRGVQVARGDRPPDEIVSLPTKGLSRWKNEYGFECFAWHWSADPGKDQDWFVRETGSIPGGASSDYWRQEHEMDTHVLRGRPTYWAFDYQRNVVSQLPVPLEKLRTWTIFLSADFGATDPTCWLFWAEDPETKTLLIFDSIYESNKPVLWFKKRIYEKLRAFAGVEEGAEFSFHSVVRYAVGDPSGKGFRQEYATPPYPVPVGGNPPDALVKLNDRYAGETRLNTFFSPQFFCCKETFYHEWATCPKCGREHRGRPRLLIYEKGAPQLVEQIPKQRKVVPTNPELEATQKDVRVPDHAVDAAKYGALTRTPEGATVQNFAKREEQKVGTRRDKRFQAHLERTMEQAAAWQEEAEEGVDFTSWVKMYYPTPEEQADVL